MGERLGMAGIGLVCLFIGVLILKSFGCSRGKRVRCRQCREWINIEARVCPYCHVNIDDRFFSVNGWIKDAHYSKFGFGLFVIFLGFIMFVGAVGIL